MCGIAGYIGLSEIPSEQICSTLEVMKNRGPDNQSTRQLQTLESNNINVTFLHSRLSIIDLSDRSNQPFSIEESTIIFNGEIYNYIEVRKELETHGVSFKTTSDTEVLLQCYRIFGLDGLKKLEGMWSFAIWDNSSQKLILCRDRFGEKPLFFAETNQGIYFASETKMIQTLSDSQFDLNHNQILRYVFLGYKSLYKNAETYFRNIYEVPAAHYIIIEKNLQKSRACYWNPTIHIREQSLSDCIEEAKHHLLESLKIRLRSDVPLAFCLSGGVDSSTLVSIAAKIFNCSVNTFSIIDSDKRYNEYDNIIATIEDISCKHHIIEIDHQHTLDNLSQLVSYHNAPVATTTYYVHSLLSREISRQGFKVAFSGTSADELYTGYYDHYLLQLAELYQTEEYNDRLHDWEKHISSFIRNPILKNPMLYVSDPNFRDHIFDNHKESLQWLGDAYKNTFNEVFKENKYTHLILRNRMLNELFVEATPVILHEDDLNSMFYSIENRSPYLDSKLFEYMYSVPTKHLIKNGYTKYILRESMKGILNDTVRLDRQKKGFNASINSLFNFTDKNLRDRLFNPQNAVFSYVDRTFVMQLLEQQELANHYSKFLFNVINTQLFLETL